MYESGNLTRPVELGAMSGATYAGAAKASARDNGSKDVESGDTGVKPVFLKNRDVPEGKPLLHEEIYVAIHKHLGSTKNLKGLQKIGGLWRIYFTDRADRIALISTGLNIRGVSAPIYDTNPFVNRHDPTTSLKVIVKDIPLSVNDEMIANEIEKQKCKVLSKVQRMKLRVNGLLTDCHTGDRMLFIEPPSKPLPRAMNMGGFRARIYHEGQEKGPTLCSKCLTKGHHASTCVNDVVCRKCSQAGHKAAECVRQASNDMTSVQKPASPVQKTSDGPTSSTGDPNANESEREIEMSQPEHIMRSDHALRNNKETPRAQAKITQFISAESVRGNTSLRDSESDDDEFEDADTHEDEEQEYSDMSADSPKLPEDGKGFAGAKRKQKTRSKPAKKKSEK